MEGEEEGGGCMGEGVGGMEREGGTERRRVGAR